MNDNDEYGFWDADRDRSITAAIPRLKRSTPTSSNRVDDTGSVSVRSTRSARSVRPAATVRASRPPNPLTRRLGAMLVVSALALPVAWLMRGTDAADELSSLDPAADAAALDPTLVDPAGVDPALSQPVVTAAVAVTVAPAAAVAPSVVATSPVATLPPSTEAVTTAAVTTEAVTTEAPTTEAVTTEAATTAPAITVAPETTVARPAAAVAVPVVETKPVCSLEYEVNAGDYWIAIADAAGVKLADLLKANGATVATPIYPGRSICLPAGATVPTPTTAPPTTAPPTTVKATTTTVKATTTTVKATTTTVKPTATTVKPTPTTAAPTTTTPSDAPPANTYSRAEVESIIRNVWPDDLEDEAVRIATRESNLIPTVRNYCCFGLFQIYFNANKASLVSWGITSASQLYDPQVNAYAAYAMYLRSGWGPWKL